MGRQDVKSREYKVMLRADRFAGPDDTVRARIGEFWADLGLALGDREASLEGSFEEIKHRRRVRFYDTADRLLHESSYVFRERVDADTGAREMTLKYRHPDRYVAADREMSASGRDAETKFEEDVKPPFASVFSFSTTAPVGPEDAFDTLRHVAELYPGLPDALDDLPEHVPLELVGDFSARETVFVGGEILLGKHRIPARSAVVMWHDDDDPATPPVVVEFSYKYGDDQEDYGGSLARDAHNLLQVLFTALPKWVSGKAVTKTGLVYRSAPPEDGAKAKMKGKATPAAKASAAKKPAGKKPGGKKPAGKKSTKRASAKKSRQ
jgi:hypothetical protein